MIFEIEKDVLQDLIALKGKDQAIEEMIATYRLLVVQMAEEIEQSN